MGFFDKIFGRGTGDDKNHDPGERLEWSPLVSLSQLDEVVKESTEVPVLIFKHSTRCGISRMAYKNFEREMDAGAPVKLYYLDILNHRDVSGAVAERFGVIHESPQLLLLRNGKVVYNESHGAITAGKLLEQLG
ncbi:bacillithiol system redox-active protein YtxJ [Sinomicrobium soli]|uniref:bacillithiol system redox-active protein YtxJ n=1 Tax=Sinomicrobium sp. N-1-3-6 TaxID=2219864 RepID=UPI000DCE4EAC|nr:bacillithiol system redox-active protein YtxJ [Sinomicrobium sp. N-1-3-6]RAV28728.1 bacillithiol system redox-active protein YtxJ [Sinomicrobium sp. N-1-3-6]